MSEIVYGIERWNEDERRWMPDRFRGCTSIEEAAEVMQILEDNYPNWEMRLAQYTKQDYQTVRSFGN